MVATEPNKQQLTGRSKAGQDLLRFDFAVILSGRVCVSRNFQWKATWPPQRFNSQASIFVRPVLSEFLGLLFGGWPVTEVARSQKFILSSSSFTPPQVYLEEHALVNLHWTHAYCFICIWIEEAPHMRRLEFLWAFYVSRHHILIALLWQGPPENRFIALRTQNWEHNLRQRSWVWVDRQSFGTKDPSVALFPRHAGFARGLTRFCWAMAKTCWGDGESQPDDAMLSSSICFLAALGFWWCFRLQACSQEKTIVLPDWVVSKML